MQKGRQVQPGDRRSAGLVTEDDGICARDVIEAAPDALVLVDESGQIVLVNEPAEQLFGYARHEMVGQQVEVLVPESLRLAHVRHRAGFAERPRRRTMGPGPVRFAVRKDGTAFPVEICLSRLVARKRFLVMFSIRDISRPRNWTVALTLSPSSRNRMMFFSLKS